MIDLASLVADEIALSFAEKEDDCFINGDGTSTYGGIVGILPKLTDGSHTAGAITAATDVDTFAEVTAADLASLMGALPSYARRGARW
ncbi:phage major capsid protein, partial [Klebsiella pneumoniae]|nr:phage major capsid protein [Klebsiella pneumoniae]